MAGNPVEREERKEREEYEDNNFTDEEDAVWEDNRAEDEYASLS